MKPTLLILAAGMGSRYGGLKQLDEIIFFFDGDSPGKMAVEKYANQLTIDNEKLIISQVQTPENEDINSLIIK